MVILKTLEVVYRAGVGYLNLDRLRADGLRGKKITACVSYVPRASGHLYVTL